MISLPIDDLRAEIKDAFSSSGHVILTAPTGSGKSTRVPGFLLDDGIAGDKEIVVLQPRRIAARMLAQRVAEEREVSLGTEVGYQVRFESHVSRHTRIRFVTEGILLRELITDPDLSEVGVILFDEFHERHLQGDLLLARAREMQKTSRPDLKLGVLSATLDVDLVQNYLGEGPVLQSEGRTFPVETNYRKRRQEEPIWEMAARVWQSSLNDFPEGDCLIFMPGAYEIRQTIESLKQCFQSEDWDLYPLYSDLTPEAQDMAVRPAERRKVIVATNVAETSLTIPGVRMVIDSGLARIARFDPRRGIDTLFIEKISQASAEQRAGRAGRTAPGQCIRLWSEDEHRSRARSELPEIKRVDLAEPFLLMAAVAGLDLKKWADYAWVEGPDELAAERAVNLLTDLGAVDLDGRITKEGQEMLAYPVHPRYARMLHAAEEYGCVRAVALIAALSQERSILMPVRGKHAKELREDILGDEGSSDFFQEMRAFRFAENKQFRKDLCGKLAIQGATARRVGKVRDRFLQIAQQRGLKIEEKAGEGDGVRKCILIGFSDQLAHRIDGGTLRCDILHGRRGELTRDTIVREADWLVAAELTEIEKSTGGVDLRLSRLTAVEVEWLEELFPEAWQNTDETRWNPNTRRVEAVRLKRFRDLIVAHEASAEPDPSIAAGILADRIQEGDLILKKWDDSVERWITRLNCLSEWRPDWELPPIREEDRNDILIEICHGALSYKEIKDREVMPSVKGWLTPPQVQLMEGEAPDRFKCPNGRRVPIRYQEGKAPVLSASIQDLYDLKKSPELAGGKVTPVLEILAPNRRPVQVTSDLEGFWQEHYPKLKVELARRYPKHEWR
ncbi:MAG: ATP-dependent helicase HrpB [Verrucomicrobiota bacterium]